MGLGAHSKKHMDLGGLHSYVDDIQAETLAGDSVPLQSQAWGTI